MGQDDAKLITAEPSDNIAVTHCHGQPFGHSLQSSIARRMAEAIIDRFKAIKIEIDQT